MKVQWNDQSNVINAELSLLLQQNPNFSNHLGKSKWVQIIKRFENSVWLVKGSYVWFKLSGILKTQELEKSGFYSILLGLPRTLPSLLFTLSSNPHPPAFMTELKQRRWWQLRKLHLKSEFALLQTLSRLFHLVQLDKRGHFFLGLNSKTLCWSSAKEKESHCLVLTSRSPQNMKLHVGIFMP